MIEAYRIGVALVLDQSRLIGPLSEMLKAFERVQQAVTGVQRGINDMVTSLRGAQRVANSLADTMERVARAAGNAARAGGPGMPSGGGGGGSSGGPGSASPLLLAGPRVALLSGPSPLLLAGPGGGAMVPSSGNGFSFPPPGQMPLIGNGAGGAALALGARGLTALYIVDRLVSGIGRLMDKAAAFNDALVTLEQRGANPADMEGVEAAVRRTILNVPGRTFAEATTDIGSLRSVLGESSGDNSLATAERLLPHVEQVAAALSGSSHMSMEAAMHLLFRSIEMGGGATDPATHKISDVKFDASLDASYKALMVGGGIIGERDLLNLSQQGAMVAKAMGDYPAFLRMMIAPLIDMKGSRAGTAMQAAGRQLFGGIMTKTRAEDLGTILGFDGDAYEATAGDKASKAEVYVKLKKEMLDKILTDMSGGLQAFIEKDIRPGLIAHGFVTDEQQSTELFKLASTDPFRRILSLFLTNADQVLKEQSLYDKVPTPADALSLLNKKDIGFNINALFASANNFFEELERVNRDKIIAVTQDIKGFFDFLTSQESRRGGFLHAVPTDDDLHRAAPYNRFFGFMHSFDELLGLGGHPSDYNSDIHKESYVTGGQQSSIAGDVYLDGHLLGRWMSRGASRPPAGPVGPDYRLGLPMPSTATA